MHFTIFNRRSKLQSTNEIEKDSSRVNDSNIVKEKSSQLFKIAAFAPHADDIELGCGGTLARIVDGTNAHLYYYVFVTRLRNLAGDEISQDTRLTATKKSFKYILTGESVLTEEEEKSDEFVINKDGKYGKFTFFRQFNRELYLDKEIIMKKLRHLYTSELTDIDIVFLPSAKDNHHDHKMLFEISSQIFRKQESVLFYRTVATSIYPFERFNPNIFIETSCEIEDGSTYVSLYGSGETSIISGKWTFADVKLKLLSFFSMEDDADWFDRDNILSIMKMYANDANMLTYEDKKKYSEAFEGIIRI